MHGFGEGPTEKEQQCHLAGGLLYSKKGTNIGSTGSFSVLSTHQIDDVRVSRMKFTL